MRSADIIRGASHMRASTVSSFLTAALIALGPAALAREGVPTDVSADAMTGAEAAKPRTGGRPVPESDVVSRSASSTFVERAARRRGP